MAYIGKLADILKKYRYVLLVVLVGFVLMLLPSGKGTQEEVTAETVTHEETDTTRQLAQILSQIKGAGKVEVMLTVSAGEETVYQTNEDHDAAGETSSWKIETVTVTDGSRNETGLVKQVIPEKYLGAIIVCQGADNVTVRLAIVEAVANATGLGTDKISVLKMK